jgi:hypothetical protein
LAAQAPVYAQRAHGGAGGARAEGSAAHPPPQRTSASAPTHPSGGFQLQNDVSHSRPNPPTTSKPAGSSQANTGNRTASNSGNRTASNSGNTANRSGGNTVSGNTANRGTSGNTVRNSGNTTVNNVNVNRNVAVSTNPRYAGRTVVVNPVYPPGPAWGWNHGVAWAPAPSYWGGGFWGALAIGVTSAAVFGSIVNASTHQTTQSYQVQPNSPGATLLNNYHLQQVQCGPPNLVVIYGPNNSVICANPNDMVAAGAYDLDTQQLTLVNR